jgi:enamine deaminase RidA (YjgF/YER057c/UK114 family)
MTRRLISTGSKFETEMAYSRAVVEGNWIFLSGTTGYDYTTMEISDDVVKQTEQTFINIKAAMEKAGFGLQHVVRVYYILPNADDFAACGPVLRKYFSDIRPAATMFEAKLVNPHIKIEIEVTGMRGSA